MDTFSYEYLINNYKKSYLSNYLIQKNYYEYFLLYIFNQQL